MSQRNITLTRFNRIRSDNRWVNLRLASAKDNAANAGKRRDNSSGHKGIRKMRGRWQVRLANGGKQHIGTFDTIEEAKAAYERGARQLYGEFAAP